MTITRCLTRALQRLLLQPRRVAKRVACENSHPSMPKWHFMRKASAIYCWNFHTDDISMNWKCSLSKKSRAAPEVFHTGHNRGITDTGNHARKTSGTQGNCYEARWYFRHITIIVIHSHHCLAVMKTLTRTSQTMSETQTCYPYVPHQNGLLNKKVGVFKETFYITNNYRFNFRKKMLYSCILFYSH